MRKSLTLILIPAIALGGCAVFKHKASTPDEFAVARNAPLVIPPDYSLTPPVAGTATASPQDAQQQAVEALFGGPAPRPPLSRRSARPWRGRSRGRCRLSSDPGRSCCAEV